MPIVVNYTDLAALGQLAQATGRAQARQRVADTQTQMMMAQRQMQQSAALDRAGIERDKIASRRDIALRQMELDNLMNQRKLAGEMQQIRERGEQRAREIEQRTGGQLQVEEARGESRLEVEAARRDRALEQAILRGDQQQALALLRAQQQTAEREARDEAAMQRLERQGELTLERQVLRDQAAMERALRTGGTAGRRMTQGEKDRQFQPAGGQTPEYAEIEARMHAHLLPARTQSAAPGMASTSERYREQAEKLSQLPTEQLRAWAELNPNDRLIPYVQAVLGHRERMRRTVGPGTTTGVGVAPTPTASSTLPPATPAPAPSPGPGSLLDMPQAAPEPGGAGEQTGFESMSDEELMRYLGITP